VDAAGVVGAVFAAFARRDPAALDALIDPECRFWPQGTAEAVGRAEPYAGHAGMAAFFEDVARTWDVLEVEAPDVRVAGTGVVCFGAATGRLRGRPETTRVPVIWVFRLREGRVVYGRAVATAAEARALVGPDAPASA
jgi:ketosteroid isomerase-like protein